ncbi:MAG TPA: hypothetical protein VIN40_10265 [Candidatus Tyrphobacter sp.]
MINSVREFATLEDVSDELERQQGVADLVMSQLRDAYGAGRLGVNVRLNLSNKLAGMGIKHVPVELPDNQNAPVRIYKAGSPVGQLIDAVLTVGDGTDEVVRDAAASDARAVLNKVKELVCA